MRILQTAWVPSTAGFNTGLSRLARKLMEQTTTIKSSQFRRQIMIRKFPLSRAWTRSMRNLC
jgi:hypothetical protein